MDAALIEPRSLTPDRLARRVVGIFDEAVNALKSGDGLAADGHSIDLRDYLIEATDNERLELIDALHARLALCEPELQPRMAALIGLEFQPKTPQEESADIRESLLGQLVDEAAAAEGLSRDDLIKGAFHSLAALSAITQERWKPEFDRKLGIKPGAFNSFLKAAKDKRQAEADQTAETQPQKGKAGNSGEQTRRPTDDELASMWRAKNPNTSYGLGEFRRYREGVWADIPEDTIKFEILTTLIVAKAQKVRPTAGLLRSVLECARVFIARPDTLWDPDFNAVVFKNGTLHIPTRELRQHSPEHYATSGLPYDYDPAATAPIWEAFLITTVPEAAAFLQEFSGYALTIDTSFEMALWLYGPRGSGKSTFLTGLQSAFGPRAGLLGLADIEKSRFALSNLPGKTLVVSTEQPSIYMAATHVLNSIISGEPITVERKFKDSFQITPRAKIAWAMNELPRVGDAGNGLFRRVKVVRFPPLAGPPDPEMKELIKQEGAGILNWALAGLARLRARGRFDIPPCVQSATDEFKSTNDIPAAFVAEKCITGHEYKAQSSVLYTAYRDWAIASGHKPQSSTSMAHEWERLGFEGFKADGRKYWRGIGVLG